MAGRRRYGEYSAAPLKGGRRRPRRHVLRTARLNAVGWAALVGVCGAAAVLGVLLARALGLPSWTGAVLALLPLGAVVVADRRRWAGMETGFAWGGSTREVEQIVAELRVMGVEAQAEPDPERWLERPTGPPEPPGSDIASLRYRNGDRERVWAVLRAHGFELPERGW